MFPLENVARKELILWRQDGSMGTFPIALVIQSLEMID